MKNAWRSHSIKTDNSSFGKGGTVQIFGNNLEGKGLPQQDEVAQGVSGRLRSWIFLTFGTTRVVGRQPYAPAAFTRDFSWYKFLEAESTSGHMVLSVAKEKIHSDTTENRSRDRPTSTAAP